MRALVPALDALHPHLRRVTLLLTVPWWLAFVGSWGASVANGHAGSAAFFATMAGAWLVTYAPPTWTRHGGVRFVCLVAQAPLPLLTLQGCTIEAMVLRWSDGGVIFSAPPHALWGPPLVLILRDLRDVVVRSDAN